MPWIVVTAPSRTAPPVTASQSRNRRRGQVAFWPPSRILEQVASRLDPWKEQSKKATAPWGGKRGKRESFSKPAGTRFLVGPVTLRSGVAVGDGGLQRASAGVVPPTSCRESASSGWHSAQALTNQRRGSPTSRSSTAQS